MVNTLRPTSEASLLPSHAKDADMIRPRYGSFKDPSGIQVRRRLNVLALVMSILVPWLVFVVTMAVLGFSLRHNHPNVATFVAFLTLLVVMIFGVLARIYVLCQAQSYKKIEPMWYVLVFVTALAAWILAVVLGNLNYSSNLSGYYRMAMLNLYPDANPALLHGEQMMDAGRVLWAQGTHLDFNKTAAFKLTTMYCVAPIAIGAEHMDHYDFWAVGTDCCDGRSATGFKCGEYNDPRVLGSLRLMDDHDRGFYRLAVQQAEARHNIYAKHPIFFRWLADPSAAVEADYDQGLRFYLLSIFVFLASQTAIVAGAALVTSKGPDDEP